MPRSALAARRTIGRGLATTVGGAAGNGLLNNLVAYWKLDESSGNALDSHANGLHLVDINTVTNAAGKVYATARQYTRDNNEWHKRPSDDELLSTGDVDFTLSCWCNFDTIASGAGLLTKNDASGNREYAIRFDPGLNRLVFLINHSGLFGGYVPVQASDYGVPPLGTWIFIVAWHDSVANTISIQINNGTINNVAHSLGVINSVSGFYIGLDPHAGYAMNGRIGPAMMWKSAAGLGGVLTAAQRTALFNSGNGLIYSAFTT